MPRETSVAKLLSCFSSSYKIVKNILRNFSEKTEKVVIYMKEHKK